MPNPSQRPVRDILDLVVGGPVAVHAQAAAIGRTIARDHRIAGIDRLHAIHQERIGVELGLQRAGGDRPDTPVVLLHCHVGALGPHGPAARRIVDQHFAGLRGAEAERDFPVGGDLRRPRPLRPNHLPFGISLPGERGGSQKHGKDCSDELPSHRSVSKDRKDWLPLCRDPSGKPLPAAVDNSDYVDFAVRPSISAPFYMRTAPLTAPLGHT